MKNALFGGINAAALTAMKPRASSSSLSSRNMAGLPHNMARSCAGSNVGRPRSACILPLWISAGMRPWVRKGSRVTVG